MAVPAPLHEYKNEYTDLSSKGVVRFEKHPLRALPPLRLFAPKVPTCVRPSVCPVPGEKKTPRLGVVWCGVVVWCCVV